MAQIGFHGVVFGEGFATAMRPGGEPLRFTRQERTLLSLMTPHPGRLFTRAELYAAIGSQGSDRNVDFLVNRLRTKLDDTAAERLFISTQYGEGYIWIATAASLATDPAVLVIGPVRGPVADLSLGVLKSLQRALKTRLADGHDVVLAPDLTVGAPTSAHFSIEVGFHCVAERTHAAFVLRREASRSVAATFREVFGAEDAAPAIERLAGAIVEAMWRTIALGPPAAATPTDQPLHLRMHEASALLDPPGATWLANGDQLARLRAEDPLDPTLALMWAMHLFARMTLVPGPVPLSRQAVSAVDDEIEWLVLRHLDALRDSPIMALAAAKLLLLLDRDHVDLAESLANQSFTASTAFAAALPVLGQVHAYRGELAEARRLYDEALQLCEAGSTFETYILVLKAMAFIADNDHAGAEVVFERILEIEPRHLRRFGILFLPPADDGLARRLAPLADRADRAYAERVLAYQYYRVADLFQDPAHTANVMHGPLTHLIRRFGPTVLPEEIWNELPAELQYLRVNRAPARQSPISG
ncbi:MAG TPA: winged helix-turn-helix domain-containing protein [Caulobacteraceae bacterium]|jgi:tetratricopeptide (TPR) repeat protein/DNA-binding winged helix-turn-helix (wHTH) protein